MSLTRKLLKELELNEEAIERIIAAHADTVDALRTERDAALAAVSAREDAAAERDALRQAAANHLQEAERLRNEYDDYRRQVEGERTAARREAVLRSALSRAGANEQAIPLLAKAVVTAEEDWENDALRDEAAAIEHANSELEQKTADLGSVQSVQDIAKEELGLVDPDTVIIEPIS